jgi:hypothetical protein
MENQSKRTPSNIKDIKKRLKNGEPTTFHERNIVNIYDKKKLKNKK